MNNLINQFKQSLSIINVVALNTFKETVRDKVLYSLVVFAILSIFASILAGSVSLGQEVRVIQNFSLTAMLVFLVIITIFIGTQLVFREIERKTIYFSLSKPISREQFFLGKFFGLALTVLICGLIMLTLIVGLLYYKTDSVSVPLIAAGGFVIIEAWLLIALGLLFSSFTSPLASAVYSLCLVLIGHSSSIIWTISQRSQDGLKQLLEVIYFVFPNLEKFNLRNEVVFNFGPDPIQVVAVLAYFLGYTTVLLLLGMSIFRRHEF